MDNTQENFEKNFGYESFVPLLLFILSIYIIYLILKSDYSQAFLIMLMSFVITIINNVYVNVNSSPTVFNEFLEDIATYTANIIAIILFGIIFYKGNMMIFGIIVFFAICSVLSVSRNWVSHQKNGSGLPIILNGLFFPLTYYIYSFYLGTPGDSIFIIYFLLFGTLSVSKMNFIGYSEMIQEHIRKKEEITNDALNYNLNPQNNILDSVNNLDSNKANSINSNNLHSNLNSQDNSNNLNFNNPNLQKEINNLKEQLYK